jgi:hypothetical protein
VSGLLLSASSEAFDRFFCSVFMTAPGFFFLT